MEKNDFQWWQMEPGIGIEANIMMAMDRYAKKGGQADLVQMNPADLDGKTIESVGFEVQAVNTVLKGTLMVGMREYAVS